MSAGELPDPEQAWFSRLLRSEDADVRAATREITELRCELSLTQQRAKDWRLSVNDAELDNRQKDLLDQSELAQDNARQLRREVDNLQHQNARVSARLEDAENARASAHTRNADNAVEIQRLRIELGTHVTDCANAKSRCSTAEEAFNHKQAELAVSRAECESLKQSSAMSQARVASLEVRLSEASSELCAAQQRLTASSTQCNQQLSNERSLIQQLQGQLAAARTAKTDVDVTVASLEAQLCESRQQLQLCEARLQASLQAPRKESSQIESSTQEHSSVDSSLQERAPKRAREVSTEQPCVPLSTQESLDQLQLQNTLGNLQENLNEMQEDMQHLQAEYDEQSKQNDSLWVEKEDLSRQVRLLVYEGLRNEHRGVQQLVRQDDVLAPAFGPAGSPAVPQAVLDSSAQQVISQYLVTFSDITTMQSRNVELLKVCRDLTQAKESSDAEMAHRLQQAQQELGALKESSQWQAQALKALALQSASEEREQAPSGEAAAARATQQLQTELAQAQQQLLHVQEQLSLTQAEREQARSHAQQLEQSSRKMSAQIVKLEAHAIQLSSTAHPLAVGLVPQQQLPAQPSHSAQESERLVQENQQLQQLISTIRRSSSALTDSDKDAVERLQSKLSRLEEENKSLASKLQESKVAADEMTRLAKLKERQWQRQVDAISFPSEQAAPSQDSQVVRATHEAEAQIQKLENSLTVANHEIQTLLARVSQVELSSLGNPTKKRSLGMIAGPGPEEDRYQQDIEARMYKLMEEKALVVQQLQQHKEQAQAELTAAASERTCLMQELSEARKQTAVHQAASESLTQEVAQLHKGASEIKCDVTMYARLHREAVSNFEQEVELHAKDLTALSVARTEINALRTKLTQKGRTVTSPPPAVPVVCAAGNDSGAAAEGEAQQVLAEPDASLSGLINRLESVTSHELVALQRQNSALVDQIKQMAQGGDVLASQAVEIAQLQAFKEEAGAWKQQLGEAQAQVQELQTQVSLTHKLLQQAKNELAQQAAPPESADQQAHNAQQAENELVKRSNVILGNDYTQAAAKMAALEQQIASLLEQKEQDALKLQESMALYTSEAAGKAIAEEELKSWKTWILDDQHTAADQGAITQLQQQLAVLRTEHAASTSAASASGAELDAVKTQLAEVTVENQQCHQEIERLNKTVADRDAEFELATKQAAATFDEQVSSKEQTHSAQLTRAQSENAAMLQALDQAKRQQLSELERASSNQETQKECDKLRDALHAAQQELVEVKALQPVQPVQAPADEARMAQVCTLLDQYKQLVDTKERELVDSQAKVAEISSELRSKSQSHQVEQHQLQLRCSELEDGAERHRKLSVQLQEVQDSLLAKEKMAADALHQQELLKLRLRQAEQSLNAAHSLEVINSSVISAIASQQAEAAPEPKDEAEAEPKDEAEAEPKDEAEAEPAVEDAEELAEDTPDAEEEAVDEADAGMASEPTDMVTEDAEQQPEEQPTEEEQQQLEGAEEQPTEEETAEQDMDEDADAAQMDEVEEAEPTAPDDTGADAEQGEGAEPTATDVEMSEPVVSHKTDTEVLVDQRCTLAEEPEKLGAALSLSATTFQLVVGSDAVAGTEGDEDGMDMDQQSAAEDEGQMQVDEAEEEEEQAPEEEQEEDGAMDEEEMEGEEDTQETQLEQDPEEQEPEEQDAEDELLDEANDLEGNEQDEPTQIEEMAAEEPDKAEDTEKQEEEDEEEEDEAQEEEEQEEADEQEEEEEEADEEQEDTQDVAMDEEPAEVEATQAVEEQMQKDPGEEEEDEDEEGDEEEEDCDADEEEHVEGEDEAEEGEGDAKEEDEDAEEDEAEEEAEAEAEDEEDEEGEDEEADEEEGMEDEGYGGEEEGNPDSEGQEPDDVEEPVHDEDGAVDEDEEDPNGVDLDQPAQADADDS